MADGTRAKQPLLILTDLQIYVHGVTLLPDSCALAVRLCKVNALDSTHDRLLQELNMRVLLLLRHTLSVISDYSPASERNPVIVTQVSKVAGAAAKTPSPRA